LARPMTAQLRKPLSGAAGRPRAKGAAGLRLRRLIGIIVGVTVLSKRFVRVVRKPARTSTFCIRAVDDTELLHKEHRSNKLVSTVSERAVAGTSPGMDAAARCSRLAGDLLQFSNLAWLLPSYRALMCCCILIILGPQSLE
jgi:hypothetical protein